MRSSKRSCPRFASWWPRVVDQADLVGLLRGGVDTKGGNWAEVGRRFPTTRVETLVADFRKTLPLAGLDGVVMANSLHFVRDKEPVLAGVKAMLRPGGRLIVVEYGSDRGNPWVPHPFTYARWEQMAAQAGFEQTRQLGAVPSRYLGSMYSAVTFAPLSKTVD